MIQRQRIEEFSLDGKNFMYIDLSGLKSIDGYIELIKLIESAVAKYPRASLHTISNIENVRFDTRAKGHIVRCMEHNKPYVKYAAVIGFDGVKKIMGSMVAALSGRDNLLFAFSREQAIELLLQKE